MLAPALIAMALLMFGAAAAQADDALVGYWKFDESTAGDPVVDSSGNGGTGVPTNGPVPTTDVPSQMAFPDPYSLSFNSNDSQFVAVPDPADHRYTLTNGTFSTWVKFNGWTGNWQDFLAKRTTDGSQVEYQWGYDGTNFKVSFASNGASGGNTCCTDVDYTDTQLQLDQWYFVAMSFDESSHTLKWYVDGTLEQTDQIPSNLGFGSNTGADLDIGSSYDGTSEFMDGELDDTRIYNYVLTDSQIADMASGQSGPNVNSSGQLTDPEPATSVTCNPAGWTSGGVSCTVAGTEENVVAGDPSPPVVSSVHWSTDGGQTWSSAGGTTDTALLPAGTTATDVEAYSVDSDGTQSPTATATAYTDDTSPTVTVTTPSGSLAGDQQLSGTVSLPALTQTQSPPPVVANVTVDNAPTTAPPAPISSAAPASGRPSEAVDAPATPRLVVRTSNVGVGVGMGGGPITLSAAGSRPAAGTTILGYTWTLDGRVLGHGEKVTWTAARPDHAYRIDLDVRDSNGATADATFTLKTVQRTLHTMVHAAYNSPNMSRADDATLGRLADQVRASLRRHPGGAATITCDGYASASIFPFGAHDPLNEELLSRERAQNAGHDLARALHRTDAKVVSRWFGGSDPIAPNFTLAGQARNRRVAVTATIAYSIVHVVHDG